MPVPSAVPVPVFGQLELELTLPKLTDDQRAECAAHVLPDWQGMAACRSVGDDTWFPKGDHAAPAVAVGTCAECPVRRSCLAFALAEGEDYGIWGGTTPVQRDAIRQDLATPCTTVRDTLEAHRPPSGLAVVA